MTDGIAISTLARAGARAGASGYRFKVLGWRQGKGAELLISFVTEGGHHLELRAERLKDVTVLFALRADREWWRTLFPGRKGRIDLDQACAFLIAEAMAAGRLGDGED